MGPKPIPRLMNILKDAPLGPDGYHNFVFQYDEDHYRQRIEMVQFEGHQKVLDVGCGMGQWAVQLAAKNGYVLAVDRLPRMLECTRILFDHYGVKNADTRQGELPRLKDLPDEEFELIWCWSVLMFVDRAETLREFNRLLKPGGRLLAGAVNSRGRWLYKTLTSLNILDKWLSRRGRLGTTWRTFWHGNGLHSRPNYTTLASCKGLCERFGFELVAADLDGHIDLTGQNRKLPMFSPRFAFMENNIEFIGRKVRNVGSDEPEA